MAGVRLLPPLVLVPVLALCACTGPGPEPTGATMPERVDISEYADVRAGLDSANETMTFPIDAFFLSPAALGRVGQANALLWDACMREGGRSYPPAAFDLTTSGMLPDTLYGIWSPENARQWGYGLDPANDPVMEAANEALMAAAAADPGWDPAFDVCLESTPRIPEPGRGYSGDEELAISGPAKQVADDAKMLAMTDPRWDEARARWTDCLVAEGLRLREGETSPWAPEVPEDPEAAIRTAVLDVECKARTELVETLSSLEAQYQAALIDRERAALDEVAEKEREIVERADRIIAGSGR